jgi:uncharacterized protein with NRDE domain
LERVDLSMCLLVVLREVVPDWPLVVAANRDEVYDRPGESPQLLGDEPRVFGGRDPRAGGTWLAVNQWAMVCALTNRPRRSRPAGQLVSRGQLCLDAARHRTPIAVADWVDDALAMDAYDGFNLLCGSPSHATIFYFDGRLREKPLGRGVFVVTTGDANDPSIDKVARVSQILGEVRPRPLTDWIERLESICRDHAGDPAGPVAPCVHGETAGTLSSSIVALHARDSGLNLFRHCEGRPCEFPHKTLSWPGGFFATSSTSTAG